ncbi:MAG: myo-inositol 2-dehydrogenase / D-chiro-inositol 1-dehydrogenase [Blastocatellia bacterium]|jgi:myo-inositol 2-dehydrogenase/D-chiro-inositol 1-dehydrogenase|nr:myo-inositol 2-dehydrogenase / D-chiro-inositol 1-dehydrogenase [Blastocatellia bacterium]
MPKIKIGFLGAGYIAGVHAAILARDERVQIAAIHDLDKQRSQQLAQATGATVAHSTSEVLAMCDAIYVTTPNTKHTELAILAAEEDKHVFCEKPMATSLADARRVLDAAQKTRGIFQVGHNRRFAPVYVQLQEFLREGRVAHSAHVKMNRGELLKPEWVGDPDITGGFLYETTIHMFDMLRFLFGEVTALQAIGSTHEYQEIDDFSVLLSFAGGMHATLGSSADAGWMFPFERIEVFCHHSTIVTREMESLVISEGLDGRHVEHSQHQLAKEEKWGYAQEDRAFIDSIEGGSPAVVTALDGYKSVELVDAVYESVKAGVIVTIELSA